MRTLYLFLSTIATSLSLFCACSSDTLRSGDLIFVAIPSGYNLDNDSMSEAIVEATQSGTNQDNIIHVAIAEVQSDSIWIIDATIRHGVDRHPLDTFLTDFTLRDGSAPRFIIKRVISAKDEDVARFIGLAKKQLGLPYDSAFLPDNGAAYCSELVRDSYVSKDGKPLFKEAPMNFKNAEGEMPLYWQQLFARLNMEIPQGIIGTNPKEMSLSDILKTINLDLCDYSSLSR